MFSSLIRFSAARRAGGVEVARSFDLTIVLRDARDPRGACDLARAMRISSLEMEKAPDGDPARGHVASRRPRDSSSVVAIEERSAEVDPVDVAAVTEALVHEPHRVLHRVRGS